ncbi:cell division ATP-binding protein FtsE [Nesterenkonia suensis]
MIRFEHVTRRYEPGGRPALDDVSVEFHRGDFVFLIGASGSGKSTLLRMILREGLPQQGKVTVAGQNLGLMLERRVPDYRRSVGMVFQDFRLLPDKTVFDNVAFAMRVIGAKRSQIRQRVTAVLERVGLEDLSHRYPHEISGGEQQRAAIARAIVNEPAIVLADEPTGNLDPRASDEVMKILRWINASGTTVIMATHDRVIVDRMRRRVVQLHDGALVRDDERGSYDPPRGSHAWSILRDEETSGGLRAQDPRPAPEPAPHTVTADAARSAGHPVPSAAENAENAEKPENAEKAEDASATRTGAEGDQDRDPAPAAQDEGIRVTWPEHLRSQQVESGLPEPTGEFDGAEMPDLGRDGYTMPEPEGEGADPERLRDALRQAVSSHTQMSAGPEGVAEKPKLSWLAHASGGAVDRPGSAVTPAAPGSERARRDEIEDARFRTQSGDDEPPVHEPEHPAHRGQGPRRRPPVLPAGPAGGDPAATPDEREEPVPADPEASGSAPSGPAPGPQADRDVPEIGLDALREAVSSHTQISAGPEGVAEHLHESWFTHAAPGLVDRAGSADSPAPPGSARARRDEIEDARFRTQSGDDEPPVHEPEHPAHRGQGPRRRPPVLPAGPAGGDPAATPDEREGEGGDDLPPEEGQPEEVDGDAGDDRDAGAGQRASSDRGDPAADDAPTDESGQVPRPRSSASQTTYTDTRRTAEQLGVSGERRSFWRRLRRNR